MFRKQWLVLSLGIGLLAATAFAAGTVQVGGQAMEPEKNIIQNASKSADHTTLVAAVKAAGLVEALEGKGPFTVFAPTNEAFAALPEGTVATLLKPENKAMLTAILEYHVVPGYFDTASLDRWIREGNGTAMLKTLQGGMLKVRRNGDNFIVEDAKGNTADITIANVYQSNGVIQVIDHVLMP